MVRKPRISFLLKADTSLHRWEYHSNLQSLLYYSTPLCLSQQQKYDFGWGISLRAFLRQSASGRQTCCRRRRAAKDGEKLGVYKRGKVCYNLCTTQNYLRFFWLFRKAMRSCGDIETAVPAAQYSTIQHTDIRGERSDAPRRCRAGRTSGRLCFAANFAESSLFLRVYPCIYPGNAVYHT